MSEDTAGLLMQRVTEQMAAGRDVLLTMRNAPDITQNIRDARQTLAIIVGGVAGGITGGIPEPPPPPPPPSGAYAAQPVAKPKPVKKALE